MVPSCIALRLMMMITMMIVSDDYNYYKAMVMTIIISELGYGLPMQSTASDDDYDDLKGDDDM